MIYNKILYQDIALNGWKKCLSEEETICLKTDLNDYEWYGVFNDDNLLSIFQIIDVRTKYSKNLSIYFNPEMFNSESIEKDSMKVIVDIIIFIFDSIIKISSDKEIKRIKIHTHDKMMKVIFACLADTHEKIKDIRKYGQWIEVTTR